MLIHNNILWNIEISYNKQVGKYKCDISIILTLQVSVFVW